MAAADITKRYSVFSFGCGTRFSTTVVASFKNGSFDSACVRVVFSGVRPPSTYDTVWSQKAMPSSIGLLISMNLGAISVICECIANA